MFVAKMYVLSHFHLYFQPITMPNRTAFDLFEDSFYRNGTVPILNVLQNCQQQLPNLLNRYLRSTYQHHANDPMISTPTLMAYVPSYFKFWILYAHTTPIFLFFTTIFYQKVTETTDIDGFSHCRYRNVAWKTFKSHFCCQWVGNECIAISIIQPTLKIRSDLGLAI